MKKTYIAILTAAAGLCSCIEMMDSASQADVVNPLNVSFKVKAVTGFVDADGNGTINTDFPVDGLTVRFTNFEEDAVIETLTDENGIAQTEVAPGNYTISVFGESESEGNTYYLNGSVQNKAITKDITPEQAEASNDFSIAIPPWWARSASARSSTAEAPIPRRRRPISATSSTKSTTTATRPITSTTSVSRVSCPNSQRRRSQNGPPRTD